MTYRFERMGPERLADFAALYAACHPERALGAEYFRPKFDTARFGAAWIGYLAYHESGDVAGYYGVFPCPLMLDGKPVLGAQSGDTMTHPEHRRKGLFVELAQRTYALAAESGVFHLFGVPNANSYPGFVKMGWRVPGNFKAFSTSYQPGKLAGFSRRAAAAWLAVRRVQKLPNHQGWGRGESYVARTPEYFAYKTNHGESALVTFTHGHVWLRIERGLIVIGDLFAESAAEMKSLWRDVDNFARRSGFFGVSWLVSPQAPVVEILSSLVAPVEGPPLILRDLGAAPRSAVTVVRADFDTF